ncbi:MAG: hypothetical protein KBT11_08795 [Treponema sp.]|nr:hypothetical protein [Candidatus Treponema equifaecale]
MSENTSNAETKQEESSTQVSRRLPPLLRLTRRACIFLFLTLSAFVVFYITGNFQNFLDSNTVLILMAVSFNSIMLTIFSGLAFFETIFFAIKDKRPGILFNLFFFTLTLACSIATLVLSISINNLSEGFNF